MVKITKTNTLLIVVISILAVSLVFVIERISYIEQTTIAPNSIRVEGRGLRVTLNYSSLNLKMGDVFNYSTELENVNSPSRLMLVLSAEAVVTDRLKGVPESYGISK